MSDEEDKHGELEEQLSALELDLSDEADPSEADEPDQPEQPDEETPQDAPDPSNPREQFEQAVRDLDDEQFRQAEGSRVTGGSGHPEESASGGEDERADHLDSQGAGEVWGERSEQKRSPFAEKLESVDREALPEAAEDAPESTPDQRRSDEPSAAEESAPSPRGKLERDLQDLTPSEMRRRKFDDSIEETPSSEETGGGPEPTAEKEHSAGSEQGRQRTDGPLTREEEATFEAAMRDVDRMETDPSKHRPRSTSRFEGFFKESPQRTSDDFVTPTLPKSGDALNEIPPLDESQEQMLEHCESWSRNRDLPELNLRGDRVEEATDRLGRFLQQAWSQGSRFVRIVHGRGRHSDGAPVLKPVVLEWLEDRAAPYLIGYAPERTMDGDYGSIIVELRCEED